MGVTSSDGPSQGSAIMRVKEVRLRGPRAGDPPMRVLIGITRSRKRADVVALAARPDARLLRQHPGGLRHSPEGYRVS